ncbi:branched-chain amino acid transaminase [Thermogemmatispora tikiterensis]|uniref:branched-chain amino acid transaminase n=1 Tax=Thermogemmatispora tikiterensis TaxID=1825093 RepID=UPI001CB8F19C|nr:branched-chain amino acid transaminase [Thermogemmatispora tikiterensis]
MTQTQSSQEATPQKVSIQDPLEGYAFFEGRVVPIAEAKVSIATHALQYGTACFEGIRAYWNPNHEQLYVLKMREHYQRMMHSWNVMRFNLPYSIEDLERITIELLRKHNYRQDVYIRPIAYKASLTVKPRLTGLKDEFAIYTFGMGNYVDIESGLRVCTSSWRRANSNAMPVRAKVTGGYVNSALATEDALASGFDEAIMLTHDGYVSEGSSCNLFILRNGKLATPAPSEDILEGITRNTLIQLVRDEFGMTVEERRIDRTELYASEEMFLCGTGVQVSPVISVDHRPIGSGRPGPFTMKLQALYLAACRGENDKYRHWLTPVYE